MNNTEMERAIGQMMDFYNEKFCENVDSTELLSRALPWVWESAAETCKLNNCLGKLENEPKEQCDTQIAG